MIKKSILNLIDSKKSTWPKEILKTLSSIEQTEDSFEFISRMGHLLSKNIVQKKELSLEQIRKGVFLIDTLSNDEKKLINLNLARIQEILESDHATGALKKIETLLA